MTPEQFAYWLQGFAELNPNPPTPEQWQSIREHVAAIFKKVTPPVAPVAPAPVPAAKPIPLSDMAKHFEEIAKRQSERDKERIQPWPGVQLDGRPLLIC